MHWLIAVVIVLFLHVALIFIFGARKPIYPRAVKYAPSLALAVSPSDDWLALNNATLFALPDRDGFAGSMWLAMPPLPFQAQKWAEPPRWLELPASGLGSEFRRFVQTNRFASVHLEFNLSPPLAAPFVPAHPSLADGSSLRIEGDIAKRRLLNPAKLPSWPFADVIPPSKVQVLVDAAGNVISAVLLPPENPAEISAVRNNDADQRALQYSRAFRFAPLSPDAEGAELNPSGPLSMGQLIFNWQAVPVTSTNKL